MAGIVNKLGLTDSFKGVLAPVFTCFKGDQNGSLELDHVDNYAAWLKMHHIKGVMVNSIVGEGAALGVNERKLNAESWCQACNKYGLLMLLQVGGAPMPDVIELAEHAEGLNIQGVVLLPELFYKPRHIEQLVGYCKIIARHCRSRPFLYYHIPRYTGVEFDMAEFCERADNAIPNFLGLVFDSIDLDMGSKCLHKGRVVLLGDGKLLASAMMVGFESVVPLTANILPDMLWEIYNDMISGNLRSAKQQQKRVINMIRFRTSHISMESYTGVMKNWFNEEMASENGAGFTAGMARKFF